MVAFCHKHSKKNQNTWFISLSEAMSILSLSLPPPPPPGSSTPLILALFSDPVHFIMIYYLKPLVTFYRRYSDILVHRLLAVAIGALDSYPDLLSKVKTQVGGCPTLTQLKV